MCKIYSLLFLLLLTACALPNEAQYYSFAPKNASCVDTTTDKQKEEVFEEATDILSPFMSPKMNSYKIITAEQLENRIGPLNEAIKVTTKAYKQGDPWGYYGTGYLERVKLTFITAYKYSKKDNKYHFFERSKMPARIKNDLIKAMTKVYIANELYNKSDIRLSSVYEEISLYNIAKEIPPEWIAQAKANAERWKENCDSQHNKF